ncbi:hypothetical protein WMF20_44135 [Sorangium sp. So ce834]|uniref:hypothetical protein n=1 Tax=Sorangium sp. So ce834 TaxID=3133321 RepID=UPI003F63DFB4
MRGRTSSLVFVFCFVAGGTLAACSGETTENPGGSGGSGGSGSGGTTSSTTSSTTGASSSSSSTTAASTTATSTGAGGAGGGTVCDQACDKAEECRVPVCDLFTFDCAEPAAECGARCVRDATCEQLQSLTGDAVDPELAGCLSECQGTEGGSGVECLSCSGQSGCLTACALNADCRPWLECAQACMESDPQPQCFSDCNAAHPDAEELFNAVYACTCTDCSDTCGAVVDPCNQP